MKKDRLILLFILTLLPVVVFAETGDISLDMPSLIISLLFISIFYWAFIFHPLEILFDPDKSKHLVLKLFFIRFIMILYAIISRDIKIFTVDIFMIFIVGFTLTIYTDAKTTKKELQSGVDKETLKKMTENLTQLSTLKCLKCGKTLRKNAKFCTSCGEPVNNYQTKDDTSPVVEVDSIYLYNDNVVLRNFLLEELSAQGESRNTFTTTSLNKKRNILLTIYGILTIIVVMMYYFNYPWVLCLWLGLVILSIYYLINKRYDGLKELIKRVKKHPDEDITKIIKEMKKDKPASTLNPKLKFLMVIIITIALPSLYFLHPRIIYTRYSDGYEVFRYSKGIINDNKHVTIPDTYKGKQVLAIGKSAFKNSKIESIDLPEGLEEIKTKAFSTCRNLTRVDIPSSVLEIRGSAFEYDSNLATVILHEGLKEIRGSAFYYNSALSEIYLPESLEYIGASAFEGCESLISITVPKGVTEINGATFKDCTSLKEVILHDDIISIHGETFSGDSSLNNITLPSKITEVRGNTFENCTSLTSIVIPEGVTRIGGHAFYGCSSLRDVTIPTTVKEIGSSAFRQCISLFYVKVPYDAIINERAFKESPTSVERVNYGQ